MREGSCAACLAEGRRATVSHEATVDSRGDPVVHSPCPGEVRPAWGSGCARSGLGVEQQGDLGSQRADGRARAPGKGGALRPAGDHRRKQAGAAIRVLEIHAAGRQLVDASPQVSMGSPSGAGEGG